MIEVSEKSFVPVCWSCTTEPGEDDVVNALLAIETSLFGTNGVESIPTERGTPEINGDEVRGDVARFGYATVGGEALRLFNVVSSFETCLRYSRETRSGVSLFLFEVLREWALLRCAFTWSLGDWRGDVTYKGVSLGRREVGGALVTPTWSVLEDICGDDVSQGVLC